MFTTIAAYILIGCFLLVEGRLRKSQEARSFEAGKADRGSTKYVGLAFSTSLVLLVGAPFLRLLHLGSLDNRTDIGAAGLVVMATGLFLRYWANQTLGSSYSRTLRIQANQFLIDYGPYRWVRNPGYLGTLLLFIGAGFAVTNWIVLLIVAALMLAAYIYRIRAEETMLLSEFGDQYKAYMARSWKLIPLIY